MRAFFRGKCDPLLGTIRRMVSRPFCRTVANIQNLADFRVLDGKFAEKDQTLPEFRADALRKILVSRLFADRWGDRADFDELLRVFGHLITQPGADQLGGVGLRQNLRKLGHRLTVWL